MTIAEAIREGRDRLAAAGIADARLESEYLLATASGRERQQLLIYSNDAIPDDAGARHRALTARRCRREPLQQILGETEFYGLRILVNEQVMAPRPETEMLVEQVVRRWRPEFRTILDIGTGSGCIAVALAKNIPGCTVDALDISEEALEVTARNIKLHGLETRVNAMLGDMFPENNKKYDVIVSNPPYIPTAEIGGLMPEVSKYEPRLALDGGADGLDYYKKIADGITARIGNPGLIALEVGAGQTIEVTRIICQALPGADCKITKDLAGTGRVVSAEIGG